jgi:hypothetical protein
MSWMKLSAACLICTAIACGGCDKKEYTLENTSAYMSSVRNIAERLSVRLAALGKANEGKTDAASRDQMRNEAIAICTAGSAQIAALPTDRIPIDVKEWGKGASDMALHMADVFRSGGTWATIQAEAKNLGDEGNALSSKYQ